MDEKFTRLCQAVRSLTPAGEVAVRGIPDRDDWWVCTVRVGSVVIVESSAGPMDLVLDEVTRKIKSMSTRMRAVLEGNGIDEPPPTTP
jgi:hypothetical protein